MREVTSSLCAKSQSSMDASDSDLLKTYADRFNAREFHALRDLLAVDVRVELVGMATIEGSDLVATQYFGNYRRVAGWRAQAAEVDGKPALLMTRVGMDPYFIGFKLWNTRILSVRDFRHAGYDPSSSDVVVL